MTQPRAARTPAGPAASAGPAVAVDSDQCTIE
jgi:hypothetical protein